MLLSSRQARLVLIALPFAGCLSASGPSGDLERLPPGGHHVLFIGNSLTYVNDLPATVAAIAAAAGDTIRYMTAAGPNLALIDHLNGATRAVDAIKLGGWEYIVLQQGPTPSGICRDSLVLWTQMFDPLIRSVNAEPALFMTWPSSTGQSIFDDVRISFQTAAKTVGGTFLPAGEAWRAALNEDSALRLYGADGFHPSPIGSFLAALEIYERITGRDVRTLEPHAFVAGQEFPLAVETIRLLQRAAHAANTEFPARPTTIAPRQTPTPSPIGGEVSHC